jgi:hypothetical protein
MCPGPLVALMCAMLGCADRVIPSPSENIKLPTMAETPAPEARLSVTLGEPGSRMAVSGLTPIRFDATQSTGEGLSFLIEFGDGAVANAAVAVHPVTLQPPHYMMHLVTARLTVSDRFGRTSSTSSTFRVYPLSGVCRSSSGFLETPLWIDWRPWPTFNGGRITHRIQFNSHVGQVVTGIYGAANFDQNGPLREPIHATFTGFLYDSGRIRLALDSGHALDGMVTEDDTYQILNLTAIGGPLDGHNFTLRFYSSYGVGCRAPT